MILIVTQTFAPAKGGMEAYMTGLADALGRSGNAVTVFADGKSGHDVSGPYALKRFNGWRPLRRLRKRLAVSNLARTEVIEGVFCDSWKSVEALPEGFSSPIIVLAHGAEYPLCPSGRKKRRIEGALARSAAILVNSRFTKEMVGPYLPHRDDPRLSIVHPPINPLSDPSPEACAAMRGKIKDRHPVLSVLARLEPRKGVDRVISVMPSIVAQYPSAVFLIGGRGADESRLRALVNEKGMAEHVEFLGGLDNDAKASLLSNSDVFVMPVRREGSSVEGFGISYIEAGWFGVPSLGGKGSGAEDAVIDGRTGFLCDGESDEDIAAKLRVFLDDEALRKDFGLAAKRRVCNELLWDKSLPRFLEALRGRT